VLFEDGFINGKSTATKTNAAEAICYIYKDILIPDEMNNIILFMKEKLKDEDINS
jgi:hypothetical protein